MRWSLVLSLSMFGLAMALGTIAVIPSRLAGLLGIAIFLITSFVIARRAIGPAFAFFQRYDAAIPGLSAIIYGARSWLGAKWLRRGSERSQG